MKKFLFLLFIGLIPNFLFLLALYIYDPLQFYHKPFFRDENIIDTNMRYQAAGIINNWTFDSVILGTSMLQNTSNKEASEQLSGKWVNLSIAGGSLYEREILLSYLLKTKNIQQIVLSLEPFIFHQKTTIQHYVNYQYLYDNNRLNDFRLYLNEIYLLCMLHLSNACITKTNSAYPIAWFNDFLFNQTFGGFDKWIQKADNRSMQAILKKIILLSSEDSWNDQNTLYQNLSANLISIIHDHPKTMFYILFSPFSTLYYKLNNSEKNWSILKNGLKFILHKNLPNLRLYGFDNEDFTNNINRYKDLEHYDEKVNSFMLDAIKNDTHRITLENIDEYFEEMQKKVETYDIESLRKQIIESGVLNK